MGAEKRLQDLGIVLPKAAAPVANYLPFVRVGSLLVVSGQLPFGPDGKLAPGHVGKLGAQVFNEGGQEAARLCAVNILAQAKAALGSLEKIRRCINCAPGFAALAPIMNGASDLMVQALGEAGKHTRSTVGVAELPLDAAVEIEAMFEVE